MRSLKTDDIEGFYSFPFFLVSNLFKVPIQNQNIHYGCPNQMKKK